MTLPRDNWNPMLRPWIGFPSVGIEPRRPLERGVNNVTLPCAWDTLTMPFEALDNPQHGVDNSQAKTTAIEGAMNTPKTDRKTTYKVVSNTDGATVAIYEAKSASAAAKQHLESLGHAVSVASAGEVFSYMKGHRDLLRAEQTVVGQGNALASLPVID